MEKYISEYLYKRGFDTVEKQQELLNFRQEKMRCVADMVHGHELLEKLKDAVLNGKHITVYGDYDADGIMAAFILYSGLDRLCKTPGQIHWFINDRFEDGYSITKDSIKKLLKRFPDTGVILTCDNGISAAEAIDYAMGQGILVLVTDHHEQAVPIREDCLVVDEKSLQQKAADMLVKANGVKQDRTAEEETKSRMPQIREEFCGAELARRVITELYRTCGSEEENKEFLDDLYGFSGFATITDSVPMTPANHYVARRGLEVIRKGKGFWGLLEEACGQHYRTVNGEMIGFTYGPMINAGGRVTGSAEHAFCGLQMAYEGREQECRKALQELAALNETRKDMCSRDAEAAQKLIEKENLQNDPFLFLYGAQFSEGINGLTAARLVEKYRVPAAVLSPTRKNPALYKGSARSIEVFNLFEALSSHPDKVVSGGHPMAAGLLVKEEDLEEVRALLIEDMLRIQEAEQKTEQKPTVSEQKAVDRHAAAAHIPFDFPFMAEELSIQTVNELQEAIRLLEPFGPGLEPFRIALRGPVSRLYGLRGRDGIERHAKFVMSNPAADGNRIEVLWWNHIAEVRERMTTAREFFFIGKPEIHEYNGMQSIQFIVSEVYSR